MSGNCHIEYTPPKGTKYKWNPPGLVHHPIHCEVECLTWPQSLDLSVDKFEQGYQGYLVFSSINMTPSVRKKTRFYKKALSACRAIERVGDELLKADTQPWMKKALKLKWRPPAMNQNDE
jgi:hypothetical protein